MCRIRPRGASVAEIRAEVFRRISRSTRLPSIATDCLLPRLAPRTVDRHVAEIPLNGVDSLRGVVRAGNRGRRGRPHRLIAAASHFPFPGPGAKMRRTERLYSFILSFPWTLSHRPGRDLRGGLPPIADEDGPARRDGKRTTCCRSTDRSGGNQPPEGPSTPPFRGAVPVARSVTVLSTTCVTERWWDLAGPARP